jgi:hypothetical protein
MAKKGKTPTMGSPGSSSVISSVTNASNTGQLSRDIESTGTTGAMTNDIHAVTIAGTPGAPGRSDSVVIPAPPFTPPSNTSNPPDYSTHVPGLSVTLDNAQSHVTSALDRADAAIAASSLPADAKARATGAVSQARTQSTAAINRYRSYSD